jgi:hypothetical protein
MDPQAYANDQNFGLQIVSNSANMQQQQHQQNFIMADNGQVYSPVKQNDITQAQLQTQFIPQEADTNQYVIQQTGGGQQVFYTTNITSPQNQNSNRIIQQAAVAINPNQMIQQQNHQKVRL